MAPLVSATRVSKAFGPVPLFKEISFAIEEGERVAVIGRNGSGKSTLMRIFAALEDPDDGLVSWRKHLRLSYVAQEDLFPQGATAYDVLAAALPPEDHDQERKIGEALGRINFRDKRQPVSAMSGGERKRLAVARGLITEPEFLLLDEPTNHLDIVGMRWLEDLIREGRITTMFVSHDRLFIQNVAARIVELDAGYRGGYFEVRGAYSEFLETRATYLEQLDQYRASLSNRVRREVEWLRQGAKARTTKQKARSDQARELVSELQGITRVERNAELEFSASNRKTKELIKIEGLSKAFAERVLFQNVSLILSPGSRLGVVGLNGSGKTTFLKTILGEIPPDSGRIVRAQKLRVALLAQLRSGMDRGQTLQDFLCHEGDAVVFNGVQVHVKGWAKRFLFRPEQLLMPVGQLSGGEQARATLARLMVEPADLLVLDEPTNDLDIATLEVLEDALSEFPGAVVLVTHDRYLLDRVCQIVLGLGDGGALFADHRQWERALAESRANGGDVRARTESRERLAATKLGYLEQRELDGMESRILASELRARTLEAEVGAPEITSNAAELQERCEALASLHLEIDRLYTRWAELEEKRKSLGR